MARITVRTTAAQHARISRAAALAGESVPAFVVAAAQERASRVVTERTTTVPGDWFDRLRADLDTPDDAPALTRAAARSRTGIRGRREGAQHDA